MKTTTYLFNYFNKRAFFQYTVGVIAIAVFHYSIGLGTFSTSISSYALWMLVIITASIYGIVDGVVAVAFCTIFYLFVQIGEKDDTASINLIQLFGFPSLWLLSAFIFGEIRAQLHINEMEANQKLLQLNELYDQLQKVHTETLRKQKLLEDQLGRKDVELEDAIEEILPLITIKPSQILLSLEGVILALLNPNKFSVYSVGSAGLEIVLNHGWQEHDNIPIRIDTSTPLFQSIVVHREILTLENGKDAQVLAGQGVFAIPLQEPDSGEVFGMLKIEEYGKQPMNSHTLRLLKLVCALTGNVYIYSRMYQDSIKYAIYSKKGQIYSDVLYKCLQSFFIHLAEELSFPLTSFQIVLRPSNEIAANSEMRRLIDILNKTLPKQALLFQSKIPFNELVVLVPGYSPRKLEALENQLLKSLQEPHGLSTGKIYITRKIDYLPENESF